ncbi:hypothetical protein C0991_004112 [Blastosporella zonata]|nr:hypothetical protein C0991_004112 [Blastosporella zonata]
MMAGPTLYGQDSCWSVGPSSSSLHIVEKAGAERQRREKTDLLASTDFSRLFTPPALFLKV